MLTVARDRRPARPRQPQRPRDHAVPRGPGPGERGAARRREGRHDGAGDRAGLRRPGVAGRAADGGPARSRRAAVAPRAAAAGQEPAPRLDGRGGRSRSRRSSSRPRRWGERLAPHLDDTTWLVQAALARGEHVLLEGAQGTLLDLDHGSYPFVTSSNAVAGGADDRRRDRAAPGRRGHGRDEGLRHARRARARSRPSSLDEVGEGIRERGHEVGHHDGPAAARRLVRRRADPLRGRGELGEQHHAQQARHPVRARVDPAVRRLRGRRAAGRSLAVLGRGARAARRRSTSGSRAGPSRSTTSARSPACRRTRGAT